VFFPFLILALSFETASKSSPYISFIVIAMNVEDCHAALATGYAISQLRLHGNVACPHFIFDGASHFFMFFWKKLSIMFVK